MIKLIRWFPLAVLLILASQRIEDVLGWDYGESGVATKRGSKPSLVESCILAWVAGNVLKYCCSGFI